LQLCVGVEAEVETVGTNCSLVNWHDMFYL